MMDLRVLANKAKEANKQAQDTYKEVSAQSKVVYGEFDRQYKREIEMVPTRQIKLFLSLTMAMLLLFGGLGIKPQWDKLAIKKGYNADLRKHKKTLKERITNADELEKQLEQAEPYLYTFDQVMPVYANMDDYLVEFVKNISDSGFIVQGMSKSKHNKEGIKVTVKLQGENNPKQIIELIESIEELNRISSIQQVNLALNKDESRGNINLFIYSLEALTE